MNKKNKTIWLSIITIMLIGVLAFLIYHITSGGKASGDGVVTVNYVGLDGKTIKSCEITFNEGDQIVTLIEENFENVRFIDGMIMSIEDYVTPSDWSTFISVYVDGEVSNYGLAAPEFTYTDGTIISLVITEFSYE